MWYRYILTLILYYQIACTYHPTERTYHPIARTYSPTAHTYVRKSFVGFSYFKNVLWDQIITPFIHFLFQSCIFKYDENYWLYLLLSDFMLANAILITLVKRIEYIKRKEEGRTESRRERSRRQYLSHVMLHNSFIILNQQANYWMIFTDLSNVFKF